MHYVLIVLTVAAVVYFGVRAVRARAAKPAPRVIGPDDDPDFLWKLGDGVRANPRSAGAAVKRELHPAGVGDKVWSWVVWLLMHAVAVRETTGSAARTKRREGLLVIPGNPRTAPRADRLNQGPADQCAQCDGDDRGSGNAHPGQAGVVTGGATADRHERQLAGDQ